jgi:ABC-type nickel/cobalt efflux system permease component RcnA
MKEMKRSFFHLRGFGTGVMTDPARPSGARHVLLFTCVWLVLGMQLTGEARAIHPVPRRAHDRTIVVRLAPDKVIVDYRLEVDELTVVYEDLPAFSDQIDLTRFTKPEEFYEAFTQCYAPVLAGNLVAKVDGKPLTFTWARPRWTLRDELEQKLGHLRCDFRFEAKSEVITNSPGSSRGADATPLAKHDFRLRESNYELEEGRIRLSLVSLKGVTLENKVEPDRKLLETPLSELKPGDDARLRTVSANFVVSNSRGADATPLAPSSADGTRDVTSDTVTPSTPLPSPSQVGGSSTERGSLLELVLDPDRGIWVLLLLAGFFGAVHALAPGHGKTLVAAYLVGEHGTVWHALILGLITTFTHTGAVLALAAVLLIVNPDRLPNLELVGGLLVTGMGLWLLLRRLAGQADHFHIGGHGHHHHHDQARTRSKIEHGGSRIEESVGLHDARSSILDPPSSTTMGGWWGLVALGVSGGIVPCYDAIIMLIFAVSARRLWLALPLLLAFSAGLAGVLIVIGILVVQVKGFATSRWGVSRWSKFLPLVSALLVIILGIFLCYRSMHPNS